MVKGLERECFYHYSWMDRANTTVINILFAFIDLDDICKDIEGELSSKSLGVGFVSKSHKIEEFSEHRGYLLSYINDVLYDISDYLEEPLYKGFHEAMDIMSTIDMTDGRIDNTIGLQVDVQVSGRGMSYTNKQNMSHLTLEDFIGSRYQETDGNSYVRNTYNQKVDGFAYLFAEDYKMFIQYGKLNPEESTLDDYLESIVLKEFAHKKDSPFLIELLQQLSELTVVIPIYEAYAGKTLITKDNLTKTEERYKLISATVNAFTLGYGAIISKGGVSVGKLFASEIIAEVAVSSTVIGCEKAGVPSSVTFALALLAGVGAGAVSNKVLLNDYGIKIDDLEGELGKGGPDLVDNAIEGGLKTNFASNIDDVLAKQGLSLDEFNSLRVKAVFALTNAEKSTLKAIRESVPMPDVDTLMQKVIPASDIEKYMDGTYTQVGGYVTKAEDVAQLNTYDEIYYSLRLDYPKSAFKPLADDSVGAIRYTTDEVSKVSVPYGTEMGGTATGAPPFTGNGFTKSTNGQIIPEFNCDGYLKVTDGAQLIEIQKDGTEILRAVYDTDFGKFVAIE